MANRLSCLVYSIVKLGQNIATKTYAKCYLFVLFWISESRLVTIWLSLVILALFAGLRRWFHLTFTLFYSFCLCDLCVQVQLCACHERDYIFFCDQLVCASLFPGQTMGSLEVVIHSGASIFALLSSFQNKSIEVCTLDRVGQKMEKRRN